VRFSRGPRLIATALLALGLLTGCGDDSQSVAESQPTPSAVARDLSTYDVFVLGSEENNPLFADVYGIRLEPFTVDRITTGKRVSSLGADEGTVIVAAADQDVDRLATVTGAGDLQPIPGLGRPHGFQPVVDQGVVYYQDIDDADRKDDHRFFAYDLAKQDKRLLFRTAEEVFGLAPLPDGRLMYGDPKDEQSGDLVLRSKSGSTKRYYIDGYVGGAGDAGRKWLAVTLVGDEKVSGDRPVGLVLLDPATGKMKRVPDLQVIAWNPDGTRLLARRTTSTTDSALVLIDPAKPDSQIDVHTIPGLAIFGGAWVRGTAPASH
jgi:hypothetical protein